MTKTELDALREKVAAEPEGSPARLLLAEVDRLNETAERTAHTYAKRGLINDGYTDEEAEKIISSFVAGETPKMETGPCRACNGRGRETVPGCMGVRFERCRKCNGRGRRMQFKLSE